MSTPRARLPTGQSWFMERAGQLFHISDMGVCTGVASTGIPAILARHLPIYDQRLVAINNISVARFKETIDGLKRERLLLIKEAEEELDRIRRLDPNLFDKKIIEVINEPTTKKKIITLRSTLQELIKECKLDKENENEELEKRQKSVVLNALLQKEIEKKLTKLSVTERLLLDAPIFFEEVELYHRGNLYHRYLDETSWFKSLQNIKATMPLLTPKILEERGGISFIDDFSGMYTVKLFANILAQFQTLSKDNSIDSPIALQLANGNHSISIGYDPFLPSPWIFIDAKQLPTEYFSDIHLFVEKIARAFNCKDNINLFVEIYTNKSDENAIKGLLKSIKKQQDWIDSQTVTDEKARWRDSACYTWLHIAARNGEIDRVRELIAHGAEVNEIAEGYSPLWVAVENGHLDVMEVLLAHGANEEETRDCATLLFIASRAGHLDIVKALLMKGGQVSETNYDEETPLFIASEHGHLDVVIELLEHEAKVGDKNVYGETPLFAAAKNGHLEVVKILIAHGSKVDEKNSFGNTALYIAALKGHLEVVEILISHGAKVDEKEDNDETPLHAIAYNGHNHIVKELISHGSRVDEKNNRGETPLFIALKYGHTDVVKALIEHGAKVDEKNSDGVTPLFIAVQTRRADLLQLLLNNGADSGSIIKININLLRKFAEQNRVEKRILEQFIQKKQQQHSDQTISLTPIDIATILGYTDGVHLLKLHDIRRQCREKLEELQNVNHPQWQRFFTGDKKDPQLLDKLKQEFLLLDREINRVYSQRELFFRLDRNTKTRDAGIQALIQALESRSQKLHSEVEPRKLTK